MILLNRSNSRGSEFNIASQDNVSRSHYKRNRVELDQSGREGANSTCLQAPLRQRRKKSGRGFFTESPISEFSVAHGRENLVIPISIESGIIVLRDEHTNAMRAQMAFDLTPQPNISTTKFFGIGKRRFAKQYFPNHAGFRPPSGLCRANLLHADRNPIRLRTDDVAEATGVHVNRKDWSRPRLKEFEGAIIRNLGALFIA